LGVVDKFYPEKIVRYHFFCNPSKFINHKIFDRMEPNNRYDRYRDEDNTSNYNTGYRGDSSNPNSFERNQGYQRDQSNQYYNDRNIPEQYGDNRYRGDNPQQDMNSGYNPYGSGSGYWGQYGRNWIGNYRNTKNDRKMKDDRNLWDKTTDEVSSWFGDENAKRRRRMDEINDGMHRGKGPKNYTRSSEKIREDVCELLSEDSYTDASDIDVAVKGTEITLTGTVESKLVKRRVEDLVDMVSGVSHVQNNLRVSEQRSSEENLGLAGKSSSTPNLVTRSNELSIKNTDGKFSRNANKGTNSIHN
jgi:osmotically-inducible protein OsmY